MKNGFLTHVPFDETGDLFHKSDDSLVFLRIVCSQADRVCLAVVSKDESVGNLIRDPRAIRGMKLLNSDPTNQPPQLRVFLIGKQERPVVDYLPLNIVCDRECPLRVRFNGPLSVTPNMVGTPAREFEGLMLRFLPQR